MPRKSTASVADASAPLTTSSTTAQPTLNGDTSIMSAATDISPSSKPPRTSTKADKAEADNTGIDDLLLPRTLTSRLARGTLPPNTSIQRDALLALTKAASVFISYLASHANEATTKKTIGPQDVIKALQEIEMAQVMGIGEVGPDGKVWGRLERELEVWEGVVRGKRKEYREKVKMRESGTGVGGESEEGGDEGGEREPKRARVEDDGGAGAGASAGAASSFGDTEQMLSPRPANASSGLMLTNGAAKGHSGEDGHVHDREGKDEGGDEDDTYDEGSASADGDGDETQPDEDEEDDPEDEVEDDEEQPAPDEEELDGYGPEDQLRHDMNGDQTGDESD